MFVMAFTLTFLSSCDNGNGDDVDNTKEPVITDVPGDTTEKPKETKEPGPTLKPITEDELGKPHPEAEVLLKLDFEDGEINEDEFRLLYPEFIEIEDGYMHITEEWSAVIPKYLYGLGEDHNQYEFSTTFYISHLVPDAPHAAYWVGARVPEEGYGAYPGGIWLAFNYTKDVRVFISGDNFIDPETGEVIKDFARQFFTITAPESLDEEHTITVVDTEDEIFFYMNTEDDEQYLLIRAVLDGADLIFYDKDGNEVFAGENVVNDQTSFSVFSHRTKSHTDEIILKGY